MSIETKRLLPILLFSTFLVTGEFLSAQQIDSLSPQFSWTQKGSLIQFAPHLRPLRQIAGAPEAFYTYFWEFGDGSFSFDQQPAHAFTDTGKYSVQLFATNNYDDGKAPPTHPRRIHVAQTGGTVSDQESSVFFNAGNRLQLKVNRMPKPGEDMVCIIGYQNPSGDEPVISGSLALFYNEKSFKKKNFGLTDLKNYHQEKTTDMSSLLASCKEGKIVPLYAVSQLPDHGPHHFIQTEVISNVSATSVLKGKSIQFETAHTLHFEGLKPGEKRYVFAILHTMPDMIKDTNATVTLSAVLIPDDPQQSIVENNLDLQIVASHDPNRLMLSNRRLNYRFMGEHKKLKYKVRFQNTGKGPASTIKIGVKIPSQLDPATLKLKNQYPECLPCTVSRPGQSCLETIVKNDSLHFIFKNIYLPGVRQRGVKDRDSTKGFVQYHLRFKEKPPKLPFWSQARIVFDKNEPVYTNKMHTRYLHGISPAIIAGYSKGFGRGPGANASLIIGGALAPYSPYRPYFQVEAYMGIHKKTTFTTLNPLNEPRDTAIQKVGYIITDRGAVTEKSLLTLDIVPLELRKNLNNWLAIGSGLWLQGNLNEKTVVTPFTRIKAIREGNISDRRSESFTEKQSFSNINPGVFLDLNLGRVRVGPAIGIRLLQFFSPNKTGAMFYSLWRL